MADVLEGVLPAAATEAVSEFRACHSGMVGVLSQRMAEVLTALAEPPALPPRRWTPEEIEQARDEWSRWVGNGRKQDKIRTLPSSPLLDSTVALASTSGEVAGGVKKQLEAAGLEPIGLHTRRATPTPAS